jgi:hypothetical protein
VSAGAGGAQKGSWGAWTGVMAENSGDVRECARAGPRRAREGRADWGGPRHREGEGKRTGQRLGDWRTGPARQRGKRGTRAKGTYADSLAPLGSERERERGGCGAVLAPTGGVRLSGVIRARARARAAGLVWAELAFSFFLNFLIAFYFFSLGFSIQIQIKF